MSMTTVQIQETVETGRHTLGGRERERVRKREGESKKERGRERERERRVLQHGVSIAQL